MGDESSTDRLRRSKLPQHRRAHGPLLHSPQGRRREVAGATPGRPTSGRPPLRALRRPVAAGRPPHLPAPRRRARARSTRRARGALPAVRDRSRRRGAGPGTGTRAQVGLAISLPTWPRKKPGKRARGKRPKCPSGASEVAHGVEDRAHGRACRDGRPAGERRRVQSVDAPLARARARRVGRARRRGAPRPCSGSRGGGRTRALVGGDGSPAR